MQEPERPPAASRLRWCNAVVMALLAPTASVVVWLQVPERHDAILARLLYWAMPPALLFAAVAGWLRLRGATATPLAWLRAQWPGLVLAVASTLAVAAAVPSRMRVQFDETSLYGASQNMCTQHLAVMTTGTELYQGRQVPVESTVDKRPPLFAFLVSLLHTVRGVRLDNAYVLNLVLLAMSPWLAFAAIRPRLGLVAGLCAPLLLLAVPLTTVVATSAGFELLAVVLFGLVALAARDFVARPEPRRQAWLFAVGVLFASTRYEALPALLFTAVLVAFGVRGQCRSVASTLGLLAVTPLLLSPLVLLLLHSRQAKFYPEAAGRPLLALEHLVAHTGPFLSHWFAPALANPLPGVLAWLAVVAFAVRARAGLLTMAERLFVWPVLAVTMLTLAWFLGDVREVISLRLFLPIAWLTALAPLWLVARFGDRAAWGLLALCLGLVPLRLATVARDEAMPAATAARVTAAIDELLRADQNDAATTLWVATPAQHLVAMGHAALSPDAFFRRAPNLQALRRQGDLRTILVLTTPLDAALAGGMGDPAAVLRACPHDFVMRTAGAQELAIYRLR